MSSKITKWSDLGLPSKESNYRHPENSHGPTGSTIKFGNPPVLRGRKKSDRRQAEDTPRLLRSHSPLRGEKKMIAQDLILPRRGRWHPKGDGGCPGSDRK